MKLSQCFPDEWSFSSPGAAWEEPPRPVRSSSSASPCWWAPCRPPAPSGCSSPLCSANTETKTRRKHQDHQQSVAETQQNRRPPALTFFMTRSLSFFRDSMSLFSSDSRSSTSSRCSRSSSVLSNSSWSQPEAQRTQQVRAEKKRVEESSFGKSGFIFHQSTSWVHGDVNALTAAILFNSLCLFELWTLPLCVWDRLNF